MTPPASLKALLEDYDDNDDPETKQLQEMQNEEIKRAMAEKAIHLLVSIATRL